MVKKDVDYYIKLSAANKIKAYVRYKCRKIFPEYDREIDLLLMTKKIKFKYS